MNQQAANWDHCLEYAELSDIGLRRSNNQDSMAVAIATSQEKWEQRGHLFMVADGMGAHAAGELASRLATSIVPLTYHKLLDRPPQVAMLEAVRDANAQIHSRGQASEDFRGMGTTFSALAILPLGALVAQVGDSRTYRFRGGRLEQLSFDHSLVWEMRAAGRMPAEEIPNYIPKNIITRCLGPNADVQVDLEGPFPLEPGDTFLLCSDGLSGQVKDEQIGKILACLPPKEAAQALVDLANLNGGPDNITVVIAQVNGPQVARGQRSADSAESRPTRPVHPLVWGLLGILLVVALGLFTLEYRVLAAACLVGAVVTGLLGWMQRYSTPADPYSGLEGRPLGRGPYASFDATPDASFVARLTELAQQLRDAASNEQWTIEWGPFNSYVEKAVAAGDDHREAVQNYARAISFMMNQLRQQRRKQASDSVELF